MAWENWTTSNAQRKLLCMLGSMAWLASLLLAARFMDFTEPYLPFAVAGGMIFYLRNSPPIREQIAWLVLSISFALVVHFPNTHSWLIAGSSVLALFGLGSFLMLGLRWVWSEESPRRQAFAMLAPASALVFFVFSAQRALSFANVLYPKTYDLYLYVFDGSFGFQPSFEMGKAMAGSAILRIGAFTTYLSLPFVMALVYALRLPKNSERPSWDIITLLMLAGISGWALYNIVPAAGPAYLMGSNFPWHTLPYRTLHRLFLEPVPLPADAPRNAIPSLHLAWVVLLYWNTKGLARALRLFLAVYFALTVVATLGIGEHYFVDLVAGLPFALFVQAAVSPGTQIAIHRRAIAAGSGLAMTVFWLLLVRLGAKWMLVSPLLPWSLVAATCVAVWLIQQQFRLSKSTLSDVSLQQPRALSANA